MSTIENRTPGEQEAIDNLHGIARAFCPTVTSSPLREALIGHLFRNCEVMRLPDATRITDAFIRDNAHLFMKGA